MDSEHGANGSMTHHHLTELRPHGAIEVWLQDYSACGKHALVSLGRPGDDAPFTLTNEELDDLVQWWGQVRTGLSDYIIDRPRAAECDSATADALLHAAQDLLGARQDQMLTVDEWIALARTVAMRTGRKTRDLLTERDFEDARRYEVIWEETIDGPLPEGEG